MVRKDNHMKKRLIAYSLLIIAVLLFIISHQKKVTLHDQFLPDSVMTIGDSVSGNYLAARFATGIDDLASAARFYVGALDKSEKTEADILQRAIPTAIGAGKIDKALRLSKKLDLKDPTLTTQLAVTVLIVESFKQKDAKTIQQLLPNLRNDGFGRLLAPLMQSWLSILEKNPKASLQMLDKIEKQYPSAKALFWSQRALVYDVIGNKDKAEKYYHKSFNDNISLRSAWLIAEFHERHTEINQAKDIYKKITDKIPDAPLGQLALSRLENNQLQKDRQVTIKDGLAAALYDIASVLYQEGSNRMAVLYGQMAYYLAPQDPFINLLLGDIFSNAKVKQTAIGFYNAITPNEDLYILAQLRLAGLYEYEGNITQALEILKQLSNNPLIKRQAISEIADIYRRQEEFDKAIPFYNKILDAIEEPKESDWPLFYARAICLERTGALDKSEKDLKQALKLSPNQPEVLNYLAYTWADHSKNLEKALEMLQRALAASPQDPYISDSVGWALYRLNRFEEALPYIENSVLGLPDDPTVNDHLGDVYWQLGRYHEAEFQWERALKYTSAKDFKMKRSIKKKLRHGLPKLEEIKKVDKKD